MELYWPYCNIQENDTSINAILSINTSGYINIHAYYIKSYVCFQNTNNIIKLELKIYNLSFKKIFYM